MDFTRVRLFLRRRFDAGRASGGYSPRPPTTAGASLWGIGLFVGAPFVEALSRALVGPGDDSDVPGGLCPGAPASQPCAWSPKRGRAVPAGIFHARLRAASHGHRVGAARVLYV